MKIKKLLITIIVILAIVALGIKGKGLLKKRQEEVANEDLPIKSFITVNTVRAKNGDEVETKESFLATIASNKSIKLSTKLAGYIKKIYVEESDVVKKGEALVEIDSKEIRSNIDALNALLNAQKADLAVSRSIYERNIKLYRVGGLAKEKLDLSRAALGAKRAQVQSTIQKIDQAKNQLTYLLIKAPFDGVVDNLLMHEGDLAATGRPILSISNQDKKLLFSFAPTNKSKINKGQKVFYEDKMIGEVKSIYNTSKNGLVMAEVMLNKPLSQPIGASIEIDILTNRSSGCKVPNEALLHKKDGVYVMEYSDKSFTPLKVKVKLSNDNFSIISPCPKSQIAVDNEVKLAKLPAYKNVTVVGAKDE